MIRIDTLTIEEFRGIRKLTLDFKGKNFAICGPNGTGKSGVVDALEFALTGVVSRLKGEGRGEVSLKDHGPHVDSRNSPEKAKVSVTVTIPSLKKTVTIERTVKSPTAPTVTPNDANVLAVVKQVASHPEIVLSRRELIRYVVSTAGKRAEEVQALLRLDQVETVRGGLQKIANAAKKEADLSVSALSAAQAGLLEALGITTLSATNVLTAANAHRSALVLPLLTELTDSNSLNDGLATAPSGQIQRIPKTQAIEDIKNARTLLDEVAGAGTTAKVKEAVALLKPLASDPDLATGLDTESFLSSGLALTVAGACPYCDKTWNPEELRRHVTEKLARLKQVAQKRRAAETTLSPLSDLLRRSAKALDLLVEHAAKATPPVDVAALRTFSTSSTTSATTLGKFLPVADAIATAASMTAVPMAVTEALARLEKVVLALPEPSKQDTARVWLTRAQERMDAYRKAKRAQKSATDRSVLTKRVFDTYVAASDGVLTGIYKTVQDNFAALYRFINREDEDKFSAKLIPSMGKLGFDVDFYGRGHFPPGAYHSEGHQDGMGLCLYLALMRHLQGDAFTFVILDDVLMSVDAGHRKEVCALLKRDFKDTQFVMTTHDPIWLEHMRTEQLITRKSGVRFRKWDVDHGPTEWDDRDVWQEIEHHLGRKDVRAAAGLLRHYLEYFAGELCHRLRAPVEYRSDAQHQLGELLPAAIRELRTLYSKAKVAEGSWDKRDVVAKLGDIQSAFDAAAAACQAEQWQVNDAIHFNTWENLSDVEFRPVVKAFQALLTCFACSTCHDLLRVTSEREARDGLRCECGSTSWNLKEKPKSQKAKTKATTS